MVFEQMPFETIVATTNVIRTNTLWTNVIRTNDPLSKATGRFFHNVPTVWPIGNDIFVNSVNI